MDISDSEYSVMCAIWQDNPCTAAQIVERLNQTEVWHEKTVKTLVGRLVKKGALTFEKQGKVYWYSSALDQNDYRQKKSLSFVEKLFDGKVSPLIAAFAKNNSLNKQDVEELKSIIDNWESTND